MCRYWLLIGQFPYGLFSGGSGLVCAAMKKPAEQTLFIYDPKTDNAPQLGEQSSQRSPGGELVPGYQGGTMKGHDGSVSGLFALLKP